MLLLVGEPSSTPFVEFGVIRPNDDIAVHDPIYPAVHRPPQSCAGEVRAMLESLMRTPVIPDEPAGHYSYEATHWLRDRGLIIPTLGRAPGPGGPETVMAGRGIDVRELGSGTDVVWLS